MIDNKPILKELMSNSLAEDFESALENIQIIGFLIERHVQNRYGEEDYKILLTNKFVNSILTDWDVELLKYFLFFTLLNYPNKATATAVALGRCFDNTMQEALCNGIELYRWKDDGTTIRLVKAITDAIYDANSLSLKTLALFKDIIINGPDSAKKILYQSFEHDPNNYIFR